MKNLFANTLSNKKFTIPILSITLLSISLLVIKITYNDTNNNIKINQYHSGIGDNIVGNKIIINQKYSDTQYIRAWPKDLGGNDTYQLR